MTEFYHQNELDDAVGIGYIVLVTVLVVTTLAIALILLHGRDAPSKTPSVETQSQRMDGSNAGANAVTLEELESEGLL